MIEPSTDAFQEFFHASRELIVPSVEQTATGVLAFERISKPAMIDKGVQDAIVSARSTTQTPIGHGFIEVAASDISDSKEGKLPVSLGGRWLTLRPSDLFETNWLTQHLGRASEGEASTVAREYDIFDSLTLPTARSKIAVRPAWRPQIEAAGSIAEIVGILRLFRLDAIANRLRYLRDLADDDPDATPLNLDSLRFMALFTMSERRLPDPRISVSPDGLAHIEWRLPTNGILAIEFLTSGLIRFAAISAPAQPKVDRMHVSGTLPKDEALAAVKSFTKQLAAK